MTTAEIDLKSVLWFIGLFVGLIGSIVGYGFNQISKIFKKLDVCVKKTDCVRSQDLIRVKLNDEKSALEMKVAELKNDINISLAGLKDDNKAAEDRIIKHIDNLQNRDILKKIEETLARK